MPILLVPSDYSSSTPTMSAEEASKAENEGKSVIVETTMGEVSGPSISCFRLVLRCAPGEGSSGEAGA